MRVVLTLALSLCLVSPLTAADEKPKRDPEAVFKKLDKNSDGVLSLEEFKGKKDATKAEAQFKRLDKDSSGTISLEEFKAAGKKKADK